MARPRALVAVILVGAVVVGSGIPARAEDSDRFRPYLQLKFFDTNPATGVHDLYGLSLGANLNRYFGVELSMDHYELKPDISPYGTIGEYSVFAVIPQVRVRYPMLQDRLVPYLVGGVGVTFNHFNDRKPKGYGLLIQDMSSSVVAGTAGGGIEYFLADNIAFGMEVRYLLAPDPTLRVQGNQEKVKISAPLITFGLRLFYPELAPAPMAEARGDVPTRLYVGARAGVSVLLDDEMIPGLTAEPTLNKAFGLSLGVNYGRYLGLELAADGYEVNLNLRGVGEIDEYALYTVIPTLRVRYPTLGDRLQPYVLGGFGYSHTEANDRKQAGKDLSIQAQSNSWAMAFGAGVEYFVTSNVAVGLEMKYLYAPNHPITIAPNPTRDATLSAMIFAISLRAFLFDIPAWKPFAPAAPSSSARPTAVH